MLNGRPFLRLFALTLLALLGLLSVGGFSAAPPALAASSGSAVIRSAPAKLSPNLAKNPLVTHAQPSCGFRSVRISQHESSAYWKNCVNHGQRINVDRAFYPDYQTCVGAGQDRYLGSGLVPVGPGAIRGASVVGHC